MTPSQPIQLPLLSRANEKLLGKLEQKKQRAETGLFVVEGLRLVEEALASGLEIAWAVTSVPGSGQPEDSRAAALVSSLAGRGLTVYQAEAESLRRALDVVTPQAVAAVCRIPESDSATWNPPERSVLAVCDRIGQPGNLGSLVRVAVAAGAGAVALTPGTVDPWNPKCVRGAMGALFRLPIFSFKSDTELKDFLDRHGFALYAAAAGGSDIFGMKSFPARTAVLFGSEAHGVEPGRFSSDLSTLSVPMAAGVESLNVAVAAGIILYQVGLRQ